MKNLKNFLILLSVISSVGFAAPAKNKNATKKAAAKSSRPVKAQEKARPVVAENSNLKRQLYQALQLSQSGQYQQAAIQLFSLARRPELQN